MRQRSYERSRAHRSRSDVGAWELRTAGGRSKIGRPSKAWKTWDRYAEPPQVKPARPYIEKEDGGRWCQRRGVDVIWQCVQSGRPYRTHQPCTALDCATCYPRVKMRRGKRIAERIGGGALGAWVFTVPHELRNKIGIPQAQDLRAKLAAMLRGCFRREYGAEIGLVVAFHPSGDRCDRCNHKEAEDPLRANVTGACPRCGAPPRWLPHFDVLMPLQGTRGGAIYRLPYPLPRAVLGRIKAAWSDLILTIAAATNAHLRDETAALLAQGGAAPDARTCDGVDGGCGQCSICRNLRRSIVDYRYMQPSAIGKKIHRITYSARPFPAWCADNDEGDPAIGSLRTPAPYGLAAPGATKGAKDHTDAEDCACIVCRWRDAVSLEMPAAEPPLCKCCTPPQPIEVVDLCKVHSQRWQALRWIELYDEAETTKGQPRAGPDPDLGEDLAEPEDDPPQGYAYHFDPTIDTF